MRLPLAFAASLMGITLIGAACTSGATAPADSSSRPNATVADAAWQRATLLDVRSGKSFSVASLRGKLVALEPMAIWCSNCRIQQHEVASALAVLASQDLVYIGVDIDPNEQEDSLAAYASEQGFDWPFVVASRDVARSLAGAFGDQVLSPPSTPLVLVDPDGHVVDVHFGIRRADELEALFRQHLP